MTNPFAIVCENVGSSLARRGTLSMPNRKTIETPAILIYTNAGAVPHLTRDIVQSMLGYENLALNISLGHFIKFPGTYGLKKMEQNIQEFAGLNEFPTYLSVQDSLNPMPHHFNDKSTVSVWDSAGRRRIEVQDYELFVKQAAPDLFECLGDTLQSSVSNKRADKSINRSVQHLDNLIGLFGEDSNRKLFASLEGGDLIDKRVSMARTVSQRPVAGFAVNGIREDSYSDDVALLTNLLKRVYGELPVDKPRLLHSVGSPRMILEAIANGTDLLDGSYLTKLKYKNIALNIPFEIYHHQEATEHSQINSIMINISNVEFKEYLQPISSQCPCYTCSKYTCAYLHHLLITKEMLLPTLLMIHNINQYQRFFSEIREQITKQTFDNYKKKIDNLCKSNPVTI
ncbi:Queuine tRNA-ribosyltransferase subunit QTRTD1 isoform X2 [Oopsacas minuta]|uniref:Queuine tRNA-ribosyltransferase accessory subunit 2 n=1 Tax=Oopsacas minuta TaxID=111878 RepID=A0AAV7KQT9_9METZ|nr:Queuine tRNA-ribosyltransferase subunit QTRTD1 isoform X2 [Oopsacas minuta]